MFCLWDSAFASASTRDLIVSANEFFVYYEKLYVPDSYLGTLDLNLAAYYESVGVIILQKSFYDIYVELPYLFTSKSKSDRVL